MSSIEYHKILEIRSARSKILDAAAYCLISKIVMSLGDSEKLLQTQKDFEKIINNYNSNMPTKEFLKKVENYCKFKNNS